VSILVFCLLLLPLLQLLLLLLLLLPHPAAPCATAGASILTRTLLALPACSAAAANWHSLSMHSLAAALAPLQNTP
jgi:hypothetical protein